MSVAAKYLLISLHMASFKAVHFILTIFKLKNVKHKRENYFTLFFKGTINDNIHQTEN